MDSDNNVKKKTDDERCLDMAEWLEHRAEQLIGEGSAREAIGVYHKLLQVGRDDDALLERIHLRMAEVFLGIGDRYRAETHLKETLKMNPDNAYGLCLLGRLCLEAKDWTKAAKCGFHACLREPDVSDYHQLFGRALLCGGNIEEGCDELETAIEIDPDNVIAVCDLAIAYAELSRFDDAENLLIDTMDRHPANTILRDAMFSVQRVQDTTGMRENIPEKQLRSTAIEWAKRVAHDQLVHELTDRAFSQDEIKCAERLLKDFVSIENIHIGNPTVLAAACDYAISRIIEMDGVTQAKIAALYCVSASAISRRYRTIVERLGLVPNDTRYTPDQVTR